jgi:hypothetical protein
MTENNKYEPGCYGDCSFGPHHTMKKVFEISFDEEFDYHLDKEDYALVTRFMRGEIGEDEEDIYSTLSCIEDEAIDYLNEHCSDDTHYWGYETGDFGYWEIDEE